MITAIALVIAGLIILVWSADRFVDGASGIAAYLGMPPLLIGMIIVGFGTSAPEMFVSAMSAVKGNPGIAIGNAYGSNITNIALILGITSLIAPITVKSAVLRRELPVLTAATLLAAWQIHDGEITRVEAAILLTVFACLIAWSVWQSVNKKPDEFSTEVEDMLKEKSRPLGRSLFSLSAGLVLLIASSHLLVTGAVKIATSLGVSDLVIGLTVVAIGTSLPELASSIAAARKGEHEIALGNVIGSNLFNTMAVVGIAGSVRPFSVSPEVFTRDMSAMLLLTVSLFVTGWGFKGRQGRINRFEGGFLVLFYAAYTAMLLITA